MASGGEAANRRPGISFTVSVVKAQGSGLGIDITYSSGPVWTKQGIAIARIFEEGVVAAWNARSKSYRVQPGDFIVQVNEVQGDTNAMIAEMKSKQNLVLHVWRSEHAAQHHRFGASVTYQSSPVKRPPVQKSSEPVAALSTVEVLQQVKGLGDVPAISLICAALHTRPDLASAVLETENGEEQAQGNHAENASAEEAQVEAATKDETENGDEALQSHQAAEECSVGETKVEPATTEEVIVESTADAAVEGGAAADSPTQADAAADKHAEVDTETPPREDADAKLHKEETCAEAAPSAAVEADTQVQCQMQVEAVSGSAGHDDSEVVSAAAPEAKAEAEIGTASAGTSEVPTAVQAATQAETKAEADTEPKDPPAAHEGAEENAKEIVAQGSEEKVEQLADVGSIVQSDEAAAAPIAVET